MSRRLYSHTRVRYWFAYDVDDICTTFADLGLHPQTVRKWIKNGLKTIDGGKPALIYGNDLIAYLKNQNTKNKCTTEFDQLFCMTCQDARPVFQKRIVVEQKRQFLKVSGRCRQCKTTMFKSYKMEAFPELRRGFVLVDVLELYDFEVSSDKTHIATQKQSPASEPVQGRLF